MQQYCTMRNMNTIQKCLLSTNKSQFLTSPSVRRLSRQHQINLCNVTGTGRKQRILKEDILQYITHRHSQQIAPTIHRMTAKQVRLCTIANESRLIPHLNFQQLISLNQVRKITNTKVSLEAVLLKLLSLALIQHPKINSQYHPQNAFQYQTVSQHQFHLHLYGTTYAVDDVRTLSVKQIAFTKVQQQIPNSLSVHFYNAGIKVQERINRPWTTALTFGRIVKDNEGENIMVNIACDHRVIDGASAAKFIKQFKSMIEKPWVAMCEMS